MKRLVLLLVVCAGLSAHAATVPCRSGDYALGSLCLNGPPRYDVCAQRCQGSTNVGLACDTDADCPGSTCNSARGNGVTDDTLAIQTTINAASKSVAGANSIPASQHVYLPCGTYKISSTLVIHTPAGNGLTFEGESETCTTILTNNDMVMLRLGDWIFSGIDNYDWAGGTQFLDAVAVRHLFFRSTLPGGANTVGISLNAVSRGKFEHLVFGGGSAASTMKGIAVHPLSGMNFFDHISNLFRGSWGIVGDLIWIDGSAPTSCPNAPGAWCGNYNSPNNVYSNLNVHQINGSAVHATGVAFGDMQIYGVSSLTNSAPAIWLQGSAGRLYADKIAITNLQHEGPSLGFECDYCSNVALSGSAIYNYGGAPIVMTGSSHFVLNYSTPAGGVNYAQ